MSNAEGVVHVSGQSDDNVVSQPPAACRSSRVAREGSLMLPPLSTQESSASSNTTLAEKYLLKMCRTLMIYGAPTHRLEKYLHATAYVLELDVQSFYMPGCMIVAINDSSGRSGVHIVRCTQSLNLSKLYKVHKVYKDVIHARSTVGQASAQLDDIFAQSNRFPSWVRVPVYGAACACIGPVSYGARPIDLPVIFLLGSLVGFLELVVAVKSELYGYIFEVTSAIIISFLARGVGSISSKAGTLFCFSATCQASLVLILPGFTITNSALELQSKNIVSGAVRMVFGIICTLFLALGITIGATIYGAMDPNATSATTCDPSWPFWWQVVFVAPFTLCYVIVSQGPWQKQLPMIILTTIGWLVTHFSSQRFSSNLAIAQAIGAFTVGVIANLYSRLGAGLAAALLHPAIFIQVPGSLAASGSLISGVTNADLLTRHGDTTNSTTQPYTAVLNAGYSMIEIGIGIALGLSVSAFVVYPFRRRGKKSGLFSF